MDRKTIVVMATLAFGVSGCSFPDGTPGTVLADSAGVRVAVAQDPAWGWWSGWEVASDPEVQIGAVDGPADQRFGKIVGVLRMGDGRIVVADQTSGELRFFSPQGHFMGRAGGVGQRPGEFQSLDFVGLLPGDYLVTFDSRLLRYQVFDPQGAYVRGIGVRSGLGAHPGWERFSAGRIAVDLETGLMDSLSVEPGPEADVTPRGAGGYSHRAVMFSKDSEFAASGGRVALVDTRAWEVRILDGEGRLELIVRRPVEPEAATEDHVRETVENAVQQAFPPDGDTPQEDRDRLRQTWTEMPRAETLPLLRSVHLDDDGNLWVESYFPVGGEPGPFQVFAQDGTWLGGVDLPEGLQRGHNQREAPPIHFGSDFILGVWGDARAGQSVRLYRLEKD